MMARARRSFAVALAMALVATSCSPTEPNRLDEMETVRMKIGAQWFELWVADTWAKQEKGLMFVKEKQMAPLSDGTERGMLFVFSHSVRDSFWMKNTVIPLDIAYVATDGTIVTVYTMAPLDSRRRRYPPDAPYRYAIEVQAHRLSELGIGKGDTLEIPPSVLKDAP